MQRLTRRLAVGAAILAIGVAGLAGTPAEARHFHHFGFGFGFGVPVVYAPPPVVPVYAPPPVYAVYPPPPPAYGYGYGYRVHRYHRRVVRHVVHHRWCSCRCCR
jgi:hypothetical protein